MRPDRARFSDITPLPRQEALVPCGVRGIWGPQPCQSPGLMAVWAQLCIQRRPRTSSPAAYYPSGDPVRGVAFCEPGDPSSPQAREYKWSGGCCPPYSQELSSGEWPCSLHWTVWGSRENEGHAWPKVEKVATLTRSLVIPELQLPGSHSWEHLGGPALRQLPGK